MEFALIFTPVSERSHHRDERKVGTLSIETLPRNPQLGRKPTIIVVGEKIPIIVRRDKPA